MSVVLMSCKRTKKMINFMMYFFQQKKLRLGLDIKNLENQCLSVTDLLIKHGLFLRIYELKDKFRYLIKQDSEKKTVMRDLSSCGVEKCNGYKN